MAPGVPAAQLTAAPRCAVLPCAGGIASVKDIGRTRKIFGDLDQIDISGGIKESLVGIRGPAFDFTYW